MWQPTRFAISCHFARATKGDINGITPIVHSQNFPQAPRVKEQISQGSWVRQARAKTRRSAAVCDERCDFCKWSTTHLPAEAARSHFVYFRHIRFISQPSTARQTPCVRYLLRSSLTTSLGLIFQPYSRTRKSLTRLVQAFSSPLCPLRC